MPFASVSNKAVTFCDELVQVDLLGPLVVSCLHAVEVHRLPSGKQDAFRQGESFSEIAEWVFLGCQCGVMNGGTVQEDRDIIHFFKHQIAHPESVPDDLRVVAACHQCDFQSKPSNFL